VGGGKAIGTAIAGTLVGVLVGAGTANPLTGIAAGLATVAVIGGTVALFYFAELKKWKKLADMVIYEYGKDDLDQKELENLIEKFERQTIRVQDAKKEVIKLKQKIDNQNLSVDAKDRRVNKKKRVIQEIIKYEASELAARESYRILRIELDKIVDSYGIEDFNKALPGLGSISRVLMYSMEQFGDSRRSEQTLGKPYKASKHFDERDYDKNDPEQVAKMIRDAQDAVAQAQADAQFMQVRDKILRDYNKTLKFYEKAYKRAYPQYKKEISDKYKSEIMMK